MTCHRFEWGEGLIRSWSDADWIGAARRVGGKILRLGFAPAHLWFEDMAEAAGHLREVLHMDEWNQPHFREGAAVT